MLTAVLLAGCGGDDPATSNSDRIEDCLGEIEGHNLERSPQEAPVGPGADAEFLGQADGENVSIYVAEGDTDPEAIFDEARHAEERKRRHFEQTGEDFEKLAIVRRGDAVFAFAEGLPRERRSEFEACAE